MFASLHENEIVMDYYYKIIIEPQEERGYTAYAPKVPGCVSEGEPATKLLKNQENT